MDEYAASRALFSAIDEDRQLDECQKFVCTNQAFAVYECVGFMVEAKRYIQEYIAPKDLEKAVDLEVALDDVMLAVQPITFTVTALASQAKVLSDVVLGGDMRKVTMDMVDELKAIMIILEQHQMTLQMEMPTLGHITEELANFDKATNSLSETFDNLFTFFESNFAVAGIDVFGPIEIDDEFDDFI